MTIRIVALTALMLSLTACDRIVRADEPTVGTSAPRSTIGASAPYGPARRIVSPRPLSDAEMYRAHQDAVKQLEKANKELKDAIKRLQETTPPMTGYPPEDMADGVFR